MKAHALIICAAVLAAHGETPSPALLVLNKSENALAIVDPASGAIAARVPTGEGPHELAVSPDGKMAFVANYGAQTPGSTLSVIDLAGARELHRVNLGVLRRPHGIAVSGGKVWFTAEANKLIGRYDPASNLVDWLLGTGQTGTHMVLPSRDGNTLFTANIASNTICIIDQGTGPAAWNQTVVPVGKGPEALDLSPDGRELWTAHSRDGGVSVIDVAARKVVQTLDLGTKRSNRLKFTPDGKHVLVSDMEGGELVVVDPAARKEVKRLKLGRAPEGILMDPSGSRAFVALAGDDQIALIDLRSLEVTRRFQMGKGSGPDGMAWAAR